MQKVGPGEKRRAANERELYQVIEWQKGYLVRRPAIGSVQTLDTCLDPQLPSRIDVSCML
jgi:hypothetical protein